MSGLKMSVLKEDMAGSEVGLRLQQTKRDPTQPCVIVYRAWTWGKGIPNFVFPLEIQVRFFLKRLKRLFFGEKQKTGSKAQHNKA